MEFFKDDATGAVVAITQTGFVTVAPMGAVGADKKAGWLFAHDLRARKGDEDKFTATTAKFGVEAFKDAEVAGDLILRSELDADAAVLRQSILAAAFRGDLVQ